MKNVDPFSLKRPEKREILIEVPDEDTKFSFKFVEPDAADLMKILSVYQVYCDKYIGEKALPFFSVDNQEIPVSDELFKLSAALACQQKPIDETDSTYTVEHWCALSVVRPKVMMSVCEQFNQAFAESLKNH